MKIRTHKLFQRCFTSIAALAVLAGAAFALWSRTDNAQAAVALTAGNEAEFQTALTNGDSSIDITITADFTISMEYAIKNGKQVTIHSNGVAHTISRAATYSGRLLVVQGGSILNLANIVIDGGGNTGLTGVSSLILVGKSGSLADASTLNIQTGTVLQNNLATNTDTQRSAGAVVVREGSTLNMTGGRITGNSSAYSSGGGGAILATNNGTTNGGAFIDISGGEIDNNYASYRGGAIYFQDKGDVGHLDISGDAYIHDNQAGGIGGAFFFTGNDFEVNVSGNVVISDNKALGGDGGAFAFNTGGNTGQFLNVSGDVQMTGNVANGRGGAIYANDVEIVISGAVKLNGNQATGGGAINLSGGTRGFIEISDDVQVNGNNVSYTGSDSGYGGGGIKISGSNQYLSLSDNVQVNGNEVHSDSSWSGKGGGVYISQCNDMYMSGNVQVNGNTTANTSNSNYPNNNANGGGIYFYGNYCNSRWMKLEITGGQINGNTSGGQGGGLYINLAGDFTFADAQLNGNYARDNGGGMEIHSWAWSASYPAPYINFSGDFEINDNTADSDEDGQGDGGGIYIAGSSSNGAMVLGLTSGQINGNKAAAGGAMRFNGNGTLTLGGNVELNGNTAYIPDGLNTYSNASGGAIDFGSSSGWIVNITDQAQLTGNTAGWQGGAIHIGYMGWSVQYASTLNIDGEANISNNKTLGIGCASSWICSNAGTGGGALYINYAYNNAGSVIISGDAKLNGNQAVNGEGGAIRMFYVEDAVEIADNVEICGNKAYRGGAISEHGSTNLDIVGNVKICDNEAEENGGAINLNADSQYLYVYDQVQIVNNKAGGNGGGIYVEYDYLDHVWTGTPVVFWDNTAQYGRLMTDPADIALHNSKINSSKFSWDYQYAYNNYDIAYDNSGQIVHVGRVRFDTDGATSTTPATQYYWRADHSLASDPGTPTRPGYDFAGWQGTVTTCSGAYDAVNDIYPSCVASPDQVWNFDADIVYDDVTLVALWTPKAGPIVPGVPDTGGVLGADGAVSGSIAVAAVVVFAFGSALYVSKRRRVVVCRKF